jgi:hypothetical protein
VQHIIIIILKQYKNVVSIVNITLKQSINHIMNCIASTYNASGKLVGCTEHELSTIISMQLYTVFAMSAGLYIYKSITSESWSEIAIQIGWGCVSAYTHTKRFTTQYVIPGINAALNPLFEYSAHVISATVDSDSDSVVSDEDDHCYVRVIKDGVEIQGYSSIFGLIQRLTELIEQEPRKSIEDSDDVVDVEADGHEEESTAAPSTNESDDPDISIEEQLALIEKHPMQFDFVMCQVPTLQTATSSTPQCMHVIKYDGFPRDADGLYFYDRKFVTVDHRMIEVVCQYAGAEYELDLSSPDNFYVAGNKLFDPAFMKWFMRKNHGIVIDISVNHNDEDMYTIKCIDNNAVLHTLRPCNYLYVSNTGFEVHDSGLV